LSWRSALFPSLWGHMETKRFVVLNEARESFLSPSVTTVNAALEPLKVLKVLIEGLPANSRNGLWLMNFKGVPVARTLSPFDLVYLDKEHRVVHSVALSKDSEFAPFRGQPASALVLPPQSISSSQTRDGDKLDFRPLESTEEAKTPEPVTAEPAPLSGRSRFPEIPTDAPIFAPPASSPTATEIHAGASFFPSGVVSFEPPPAIPIAEASASGPIADETSTASGDTRMPPASSIPISSLRGAAAQSAKRPFASGPILTSHVPDLKKAPEEKPAAVREPIPFPATPAARSHVPVIQEASAAELAIESYPQRSATKPQPATLGQEPAKHPRIAEPVPIAGASAAPISPAPPALPPPEAPQYLPDYVPDYGPVPKPRFSWKVRFLRWMFPDLVIKEASRPRDRRRADRQALPGLIAYFFTGGAPEPQRIANISVTGFYLETEERWMPGTVVRMTLQKLGSTGQGPADTISINSRIVRWGPDGEGFEFILSDLEE
jgi:hypothetical protein